MNQIHRIGLGVAGVAAVLTVAGALVVDGYVTAGKDIAQAAASQQDPTTVLTVEPTDSPTPSLDPITIYVNPAPSPPATPVTKPAAVVPPAPVRVAPVPVTPEPVAPVPVTPEPVVTPPTIRVIVPTPSGEVETDN